MKHAVVFSFVIIAVFTISAAQPVKDLDGQWTKFKQEHNRNYGAEEEPRRKELFRQTLESVEAHNAKYRQGLVTYEQGINFFADMTPEEKSKYSNGLLPQKGGLAGTA
ncbi:hypothetical protein WA026_023253 [Henosepilachna vigintioctopunctata]|uniref:Cathepsin propeptide inhibitor domain-containing protein n=1 Tax=Henosepilachna vigintioctopunctata TaxID=420089 RepID=A0AAW1UVN0_9CUCU